MRRVDTYAPVAGSGVAAGAGEAVALVRRVAAARRGRYWKCIIAGCLLFVVCCLVVWMFGCLIL